MAKKKIDFYDTSIKKYCCGFILGKRWNINKGYYWECLHCGKEYKYVKEKQEGRLF